MKCKFIENEYPTNGKIQNNNYLSPKLMGVLFNINVSKMLKLHQQHYIVKQNHIYIKIHMNTEIVKNRNIESLFK